MGKEEHVKKMAADAAAMSSDPATARNKRVQTMYDELMADGKHGHYETMSRVVRREVELALKAERKSVSDATNEMLLGLRMARKAFEDRDIQCGERAVIELIISQAEGRS